MKVKVEQVPNVLLIARWGVLVLALIALFVMEWSGVALTLIIIGLGLSMALRLASFRRWITAKLTNGEHD